MEDRPLITKKIVLLVAVLVVFLFGLATFFLLYKGPSQDLDEEEVQLDFVAEGSKIAGIQRLVTDGGLSRQQYEIVYKKLNSDLPAREPESKFFLFVEDSLFLTSSQRTDELEDSSLLSFDEIEDEVTDKYVLDEEEEEDEEEVDEEEYERTDAYDDETVLDTLVFTMRSESGTEYKISIYTGDDLNDIKVTIGKL